MCAISSMRMVMHPAQLVVHHMSCNNSHNSWSQQPHFVADEKQFYNKKDKSYSKGSNGLKTVMVFFVPMVQRIDSNTKRQGDHYYFKYKVINYLVAKNR